MAQSPAHKLGQIIGDRLEISIRDPLLSIAREFGLYLDYKGHRSARGNKKKVSWTDSLGNTHDLDYVLEEGGSNETVGIPRAFIESAWRRYTKHSRNKAQEIQGAIEPLAKRYKSSHPFLGVLLAGDFTKGSLDQLRSHGFALVHCPYDNIVKAFASEGIDVYSNETTSEEELQQKVDMFDVSSEAQRDRIVEEIRRLHADQLESFFDELRHSLNRKIEKVFVLPLYGNPRVFDGIADAISFIYEFDYVSVSEDFVRYELNIRYSNGDEVRATYRFRNEAIEFLKKLDQ